MRAREKTETPAQDEVAKHTWRDSGTSKCKHWTGSPALANEALFDRPTAIAKCEWRSLVYSVEQRPTDVHVINYRLPNADFRSGL